MVNIGYIEKTFEEIISKHWKFYSNLTVPLHNLCDTDEEYKLLKDSIWELHKYCNKHKKDKDPVEVTTMIDYNHKTYKNMKGELGRVDIPVEARKEGEENGLLISGHNHIDGTSFQSLGDFQTINDLNVKYSYTLGDDGVFIVKNNNLINSVPTKKIERLYQVYDRRAEDSFEEAYHEEYTRIDSEWLKMPATDEADEWYMSEIGKIYNQYYKETMPQQVIDLERVFHSEGVDINLTHIP